MPPRVNPLQMALAAGILQGTVYPIVGLALRSFTPYEIAFARACLAALTIGLFSRMSSRRIIIRKQDFLILFCASIFGTSIFYALQGYGVELASPNEAAFLMATYPLLASILAWIILKENLTSKKILGLILGLIGAFLIFTEGKGLASYGWLSLLGRIAALGASLSWSLYVVASRKLIAHTKLDAYYFTFNSFLLSIPVMFSVSVLSSTIIVPRVDSIISLIWLGVCGSGVAFLLMNNALKEAKTSTVTSALMIYPFVTVIVTILLLGQWPTMLQLAGGGLILSGVWIANFLPQ